MQFRRRELPVAYSMVALAKSTDQLFAKYLCYWIAFNSIYTTASDQIAARPGQQNLKARFRNLQLNGIPTTHLVDNLRMPHIDTPRERDQIEEIFKEFSEPLKHELIMHTSAAWFVDRTPRWQGREISRNAFGEVLNGVLKVNQTVDDRYPVWSPINKTKYSQYTQNQQSIQYQNDVSKQLLEILYTIHNNIVHGGKRADDADNLQVVAKGIPLLEMIVFNFLSDPV